MPVGWLVTPTDSDYASAHLSCWRPADFSEWLLSSPRSVFPDGLAIDHGAIYRLTLLGKLHLDIAGSAFRKLSTQPDHLKLIAAHPFLLPNAPTPKEKEPAPIPAHARAKPGNWETLKEESPFGRKLKKDGSLMEEEEMKKGEEGPTQSETPMRRRRSCRRMSIMRPILRLPVL